MEMRNKKAIAGKSKALSKEAQPAKIVHRELAQVFTNGTIVDPIYLTTDEANYCVAIKVRFIPLLLKLHVSDNA